MTNVDVVFLRMLSAPVPRVARMMRFAERLGYRTIYLGAHREHGLPGTATIEGLEVQRVGHFTPSHNGRGLARYVGGVVLFNWAAFKKMRRLRPKAVHASDIETMPAALAYRLISRAPIMYNIHDNYAERYNVGVAARSLLNALEGVAILLSSVALVPEPFRREALPRWSREHVHVVRNAPEPISCTPPVSDFGHRPVRVVYAGWIDEGRGIRDLIHLASSFPNHVEVAIAGDGDSALLKEIRDSPVTYLGRLSHEETLKHFAGSDFIAAIYAPTRPINRMAAPNKLAEAMALGRPIIVNSEVLMTANETFSGFALRMAYSEIGNLGPALIDLSHKGPEHFASMCKQSRKAYETGYSWSQLENSMLEVYDKVGLQ